MCIAPVRVISPKLKADTYICGADRFSMDVPCGHCPECNNKRVNDLVFRCYHEFLRTEQVRKRFGYGFTLFQTFTYSLENSPYSGGFRFFCKSDLQKMLKRVRKKLDSFGYQVDNNLKYIITCEYGSSPDHMHLPHYHACFFSCVPGLDPSVFDRIVHDSWKYLGDEYSDSCELGFVDRRDTGLRVVNSIYGIRYICKYVYKGTSVKEALDYNKSSDISKFVKDFCFKYGQRFGDTRFSWNYNDLKDWQIARIWKAFKVYFPHIEGYELMPFYLQSKGLGLFFLENCSYDELFDVVQLPTKSSTGFANFAIPLYYIRKVFYDYDKVSKRFILNELGKEYKKKISKDMCESYEDMFSLNRDLLDNVSKRLFGVDYDVLIRTALSGRSVAEFIHYAVYLKDRQVPPALHFLLEGGDLCKEIDTVTYALDFEDNSLDQQIADSPNWAVERFIKFKTDAENDLFGISNNFDLSTDTLTRKKLYQVSLPFHNNLKRFAGFDDLYEKLQNIKYEFTLQKNLQLDEKYKSDRSVALARSVLSPQNSIIY